MLVLFALLSCAIAQPSYDVYLSQCYVGTRCYPTQAQSSSYYGCNRVALLPGILPYCIVGGSAIPDPQTGYTGACPLSVYTTGQVCVDCTTGAMCSGQGTAGPVLGFVNPLGGIIAEYADSLRQLLLMV